MHLSGESKNGKGLLAHLTDGGYDGTGTWAALVIPFAYVFALFCTCSVDVVHGARAASAFFWGGGVFCVFDGMNGILWGQNGTAAHRRTAFLWLRFALDGIPAWCDVCMVDVCVFVACTFNILMRGGVNGKRDF